MNLKDLLIEKTEYSAEKARSSESMIHERDSSFEEHKPMEGYGQHPKEEKVSELFGLKNSFDNISVGADSKGRITIAASSEKEYHSPTLGSDRKQLKGTRKRRRYEHFGEIHTNSAEPWNSAFAYVSRKVLSENRILSDLRRASRRRLMPRQKEMIPFLTLQRDREELSRLRSSGDHDTETANKIGALETAVLRKQELENRFLRKLRIARFSNIPKPEEKHKSFIQRLFEQITEEDEENEENNNDES